jgi:hypothetical protein
MGFKVLAAKLTQAAIKIVGDIAVNVTFAHENGFTYNPITDSRVPVIVSVTVRGVMVRAKSDEDDIQVASTDDSKLLVAHADVVGFNIHAVDTVTINGDKWEIIKIVNDPAYALYKITIRNT